MLGFQAEGAAPIVRKKIISKPKTVATAIKIGNPASWKAAETARSESGGLIDMVTDREIMQAYKFLAAKEGIFVEPASAASVAGIIKLRRKNFFKNCKKKSVTVCILTGHGLKDPDSALVGVSSSPKTLPANTEAVLRAIRL